MTQIKFVELFNVVRDKGEVLDGSWDPDSEPMPAKMMSNSEVFEKTIDRSLADDFTRNMSQYYRSDISEPELSDRSVKWKMQKKEFFVKKPKTKPSGLAVVSFHQKSIKKSSVNLTDDQIDLRIQTIKREKQIKDRQRVKDFERKLSLETANSMNVMRTME